MKIGRKKYFFLAITMMLMASSLFGFFTKNRGKIVQLKIDKESELRQNWKNYAVYKRIQGINTNAVLYKTKDKKKIILPDDWKEVTTESEFENSEIPFTTNTAEIRGLNDELYGFLVYRSADRVSILTIDENTIRLYYRYVRTSKD